MQQLLVTKPFGGRSKYLTGYIHTNTNMDRTILYMSDYTVSLYSQPAQAYDMNSTHVRLMKALLWQLFKMEPSRLLPICQCSSKSDGKDAVVCTVMAGLGVASRAAIWFIKCDVGAGGKLS